MMLCAAVVRTTARQRTNPGLGVTLHGASVFVVSLGVDAGVGLGVDADAGPGAGADAGPGAGADAGPGAGAVRAATDACAGTTASVTVSAAAPAVASARRPPRRLFSQKCIAGVAFLRDVFRSRPSTRAGSRPCAGCREASSPRPRAQVRAWGGASVRGGAWDRGGRPASPGPLVLARPPDGSGWSRTQSWRVGPP